MTKLVNRAKMTTATTGTGTLTLGSAVAGYQTFANAGVANADVVRYVIEDGDAWEIGLGTYSSGTLTRGSIESSNADAALNLTGNAVVFVSAAAADLQELVDFADNFVLPTADGSNGQVLTTNGAGTLSFSTITGYTDADVDTHLNTGTAASGEVLSWTGTDYDWVTSGGAFSVVGTNNLAAIATLPDLTTGTDNFVAGDSAGANITSGSRNIVIGRLAQFTATTASDNVFLGNTAGYYATSASNIGIGFNALEGSSVINMTGGNNIGLGYQVGADLSTGTHNFLGGYRVGYNLTTGSNNVAIGNGALDAATTGGRNIAIGQDAMGLGVATDANGDNVAIGYQAGYGLTTGTDNIAIGELALTGLSGAVTGYGNVALGKNAGRRITNGGRNVAIGINAMGSGIATATSGNNVAIGENSAAALTTGIQNVAIGNGALDAATTGGRNIAIGQYAMGSGVATAASGNNVAIGQNAGRDTTTGVQNVYVGLSVGTFATTSSYNVAIGAAAFGETVSVNSDYSVAVGYKTLKKSDGDKNTALGAEAAESNSTGADNSFLGYRAGQAVTTGSRNVVIGSLAGTNASVGFGGLTTGSDNILIGCDANASSATVSNEITLGNSSITRFRVPGAGIDNTSAALSGTTPSVDVGARDTYTLTTSGNTTFTFTGVPSSGQVGTFSLIITAGGTHTLTWPASVDWAGGTAPDAPASGETDVYTFMTVNGGTTWYGFLAGDAMA